MQEPWRSKPSKFENCNSSGCECAIKILLFRDFLNSLYRITCRKKEGDFIKWKKLSFFYRFMKVAVKYELAV